MVVVVRIRTSFRLKVPRIERLRNSFAAAAFLALCATSTADMPAAPRPEPPRPDPRIGRLESFFHHYNCPAPLHVSDYLSAADQYNIDYRLLPAIAIRETRCGVEQTGNNHWGFRNGAGSFPSVEAGIEFMIHRIAEHPYYKGKTLAKKLIVYNPHSAYPGEVIRTMHQIDDSPDVR